MTAPGGWKGVRRHAVMTAGCAVRLPEISSTHAADRWGRVPASTRSEIRSEAPDRDHRTGAADARARPRLRRCGAAGAGDRVVAGSPLADRILAFDADHRAAARRSRILARSAVSGVPAARLVHAGHARHAIRHARRHGRGRRARQEPPSRRLHRRTRPPQSRCASPTAASSRVRETTNRSCFARRSAGWA